MAWVRGLCVLLTISVNVGVRMAVEPTASSMSTTVSRSTVPFETSTKYQPFQSTNRATTVTTTPTTTLHHQQRTHNNKSSNNNNNNISTKAKQQQQQNSMSESVVILTPNSERQAKDAYDKALEQFDSYGVSTRQTCTVWEKRGCQCSGTVDELTLSCRAIGLNETPTELPKNLIKL